MTSQQTSKGSPTTAEVEPDRAAKKRFRYTLPGAYVALVFACLSFTPSLLPRAGVTQGIVAGITAAIGYGIGVLGAWIWRQFPDREARAPSARSWRIFWIVAAVAIVVSFGVGQRWQAQLRDLMDVDASPIWQYLVMPLLAALLFVGFVALGRLLLSLCRALIRLLSRVMGARAARFISVVAVVLATWLVVSGVLLDGLMSAADRSFAVRDLITQEGVEEPTSLLRSGGPASVISWDDLGREGRTFTGRGPSVEQISDFTGEAAEEPIRVFAGLAAGDDAEARAAVAVQDLDTMGAFDRAYLMVATTTGSGWINPSAVDSLEYMTGGDSAVVGMQYSHLPSWISYLVDQEQARAAGRELFDAVYERWSQLAIDERPRLVIFGESLGSFGAETAFSGERDIANRTDGALLVGPPNFNVLYSEFRADRAEGTPEIDPVYRDGRIVRFTNDVQEQIEPAGDPWTGTRSLYLVHPSDPIIWWSPDLILGRPDWLEEPPGRDVLDEMVWIPFVTFWQVTADLPLAVAVPSGHGHDYRGEHVNGWVEVLQPEGWTADDTEELRGIIMGSS